MKNYLHDDTFFTHVYSTYIAHCLRAYICTHAYITAQSQRTPCTLHSIHTQIHTCLRALYMHKYVHAYAPYTYTSTCMLTRCIHTQIRTNMHTHAYTAAGQVRRVPACTTVDLHKYVLTCTHMHTLLQDKYGAYLRALQSTYFKIPKVGETVFVALPKRSDKQPKVIKALKIFQNIGCVHTYIHTYFGMCLCMYTYVRVALCMYVCVYMYAQDLPEYWVCAYIHTYILRHAPLRVYVYACGFMYVCVCIYMYAQDRPEYWVCTYIHT
jgi:hypothetical protein